MQVYVVECGVYEDKHIVAIFTTRVEAERCVGALGDNQWARTNNAKVTTWDLDPILPYPKHPRWIVVLDSQGEVISCLQTAELLDAWNVLEPVVLESYDDDTKIYVVCNAPDEASAQMIAKQQWDRCMERRAERKARRKAAKSVEILHTEQIEPNSYAK